VGSDSDPFGPGFPDALLESDRLATTSFPLDLEAVVSKEAGPREASSDRQMTEVERGPKENGRMIKAELFLLRLSVLEPIKEAGVRP
jgi:hypothetical protein